MQTHAGSWCSMIIHESNAVGYETISLMTHEKFFSDRNQ